MVGNFCATPATVAAEAMAACLGKLYPALASSEYGWGDIKYILKKNKYY